MPCKPSLKKIWEQQLCEASRVLSVLQLQVSCTEPHKDRLWFFGRYDANLLDQLHFGGLEKHEMQPTVEILLSQYSPIQQWYKNKIKHMLKKQDTGFVPVFSTKDKLRCSVWVQRSVTEISSFGLNSCFFLLWRCFTLFLLMHESALKSLKGPLKFVIVKFLGPLQAPKHFLLFRINF